MSADGVNPERMNQVFQQLGINVSWQEVMTRYEDIHNTTAMIQGLKESKKSQTDSINIDKLLKFVVDKNRISF